ncbi:MAG: structural protein P5 [Bacteroidales bacterium]|nr:structural protein P5 [Bacteroidales bacterium]
MSTPRGIRNNNPLNIRKSRDFFQGEVAAPTDKSFKQFTTPAYGYRAAFVIMFTYLTRGNNTIDKIIKTWAPPTENNTESYIANVTKRSGVGRYKVLTVNSGSDYRKIVAAMCHCENGTDADMTALNEGFALQNKIKG